MPLTNDSILNIEFREISLTPSLESYSEARAHVAGLERCLIRVMPLLSLLTSLVR